MVSEIVIKKMEGKSLTLPEFDEIVKYILNKGVDKSIQVLFLSLNTFGMKRTELFNFTLALRNSGTVLQPNDNLFEKHSTGGVGDSTSVIIVPLLASLGYKIIKSTGKSFAFTNGGKDRFNSIKNFNCELSSKQIESVLNKTNACIVSNCGEICPADRVLAEIREVCGIHDDLNLMAASIVSKKVATGAKVVLVDVKYGNATIIKNYSQAKKFAGILRYLFSKFKIKSVIALSNTIETIGEGVGNALEVVDALDVLQGKQCKLREISIKYATEMIHRVDKTYSKQELYDMLGAALDNGAAYKKFLEIVKAQGGEVKDVTNKAIFKPYKSINFVSDLNGYVGHINSLLLGELTRRMCADSHDNNIGAVLKVKIGDYVKAGDVILTFYYKEDADLEKYKSAISGCVRLTSKKIKPNKIVKKVMH